MGGRSYQRENPEQLEEKKEDQPRGKSEGTRKVETRGGFPKGGYARDSHSCEMHGRGQVQNTRASGETKCQRKEKKHDKRDKES